MVRLVLMRHGWSAWNEENRFTGWTDVDLHAIGVREAKQAGIILKEYNLPFDIVFTSVQKRAIRTTWLALEHQERMFTPVQTCWDLNERHYGALQGLNKAQTATKYGDKQVFEWRRSYAIRPPPLADAARLAQANEPPYRHVPSNRFPATESLADVYLRVVPWYKEVVEPLLRRGVHVLISAHGNSLRALIKYLDHMSDEEITKLTLPTAIPILYELDEHLQSEGRRYLGDQKVIEKRIAQAEYAMYHVDGKRGGAKKTAPKKKPAVKAPSASVSKAKRRKK